MSLRSWISSSVLILMTAAAVAAPVNQNFFGDLHWRLVGPFRGGRVLAVAGVPGQPSHFYFGSVDGGVWETHDTGRTWQPIFDNEPVGSIGAIAVAPSDPKVIYVGSGEADMRSDIAYGNGMYKSTDGGKTWSHIGLVDTYQIGKILVDPHNPDIVYVAALGHAYGPNAERGVFRSRDGGKTWQKVLYKNEDTGAIDLAMDPRYPQVLYATLWQTRRPPWNVYPPSNGPGGGLYKSTDGGDTWTQIKGHGFPAAGLGHVGLAVSPSNPDTVYALVDATDGGLYRSDDAGANWRRVSSDKRIWTRGWYFGGVTVDPKNRDIVYICDTAMYKSTDGGRTFLPFVGDPTGDDYHTLWIDPNDSSRMITGVDQGAAISVNGGKTWSSWYNQPTGQFYHVITDNQFPYWIYGAQQDSGAAAVPSRTGSHFDGISMMQFHEVTAGGESGNIAPDPDDHDIVYGGTVDKLDRHTEQTQNVDPTLAYPGIYRSVWTLPLTFSPKDRHALYFANQHLFRTTDGGKHWALISPDLTRKTLTVPSNLDPTTAADTAVTSGRRGVIYAIAPSPLKADEIWTGTDDGLIWLTHDGGKHWQDVTPSALAPWSKVGIIEAGHFDTDTAYAAIDRHRLDDYKPYIYRTHDGGKHWTEISNGIPDGSFVNVVREDPSKKGLLYAGTEFGVYVSFDDGDHWQSLQQNLPVTSVRDIDVHGDDLVIATHGRAFWVMDDITPLRQLMDPALMRTDTWLYKPAVAYRIKLADFTGTPLHRDEPAAANPPVGAYIDYYLKTDADKSVTLDILDAQGKVIRHFASTDKPVKPDVTKITATPDWYAVPQVLPASAGMHRFVWDLRQAALADNQSPGIWVVPGVYTARLTVRGHAYAQSFTVKEDPRVAVSQSDLEKQYQLANRIEAQRAQVARVSSQVIALLKQVQAMQSKAPAELAAQLAKFENAASDMTELHTIPVPYGTPGSAPGKVTSLHYLDDALATLQNAVESADTAPTTDAVAGYDKQRQASQAALEAWSEFKAKQLPPLNTALKQAGLEPLKP
ncbi:MAG TPA: hypothetical protein VFK12_03990 [Gammaproteobacteria bacterium]|nr:hypothetical protein [Gammaproteobacteria bacterium]